MFINSYRHHDGKVESLVALSKDNKDLAKDIAMHITAFRPTALSPEHLPAEDVAKQRAIYIEEAKELGRPAEMIDKIVDGKMDKSYFKELCLINQDFVKDPDMTVANLLQRNDNSIVKYVIIEAKAPEQAEQE